MLSFGLLGLLGLALGVQDTQALYKQIREPGVCSMYSTCGKKGFFGQDLPCASNTPAHEANPALLESLKSICGVEWSHACCTAAQLDTLHSSLKQAEPLIALCPACQLNFRDFYCGLTCSPDQSLFVSVTATQNVSKDAGPAVKSLAFHVDDVFGQSFFDSCKNVKFGATNGYAMDLIGGGAKDWLSFVRYMGQERPGLGSPFQIDFPQPAQDVPLPDGPERDDAVQPYNATALSCASSDPAVGCACADCPSVCLDLPDRASPAEERAGQCRVGKLQCFSFVLIILYAAALITFFFGFGIQKLWTSRTDIIQRLRHRPSDISTGYDRVPLEDPREDDGIHDWGSQSSSRPRAASETSGLAGSSPGTSVTKTRLGRGASLMEPDPTALYQPRVYGLNSFLFKVFYSLGYFCASNPYLVIAIGLAICGGLNSGWSKFAVEKDPVNLWVAPGSASAVNKAAFEQDFGPFYRTQQIFFTPIDKHSKEPILTWDLLKWIELIQNQIADLPSSRGQTLTDFCFAPTPTAETPSDCVIQGVLGYFQDNLDSWGPESWQSHLNECATSPSLCLPLNGVPLNPRLVFGGIPGFSGNHDFEGDVPADKARAVAITYVIKNSLDADYIKEVEDWETALESYLVGVSNTANKVAGVSVAFSTGVSLEKELNESTNTDVPIVVLSYCLMFLYISLNLGGTLSGLGRIFLALAKKAVRKTRNVAFKQGAIRLEEGAEEREESVRELAQQVLVRSKFMLGLWGILIVLLSVATAVGVFSFLGVKITLIIAEVIPFLVLAIGVDNVFLLSHELARQNYQAYLARQGHAEDGIAPSLGDDDVDPLPPVAERVAHALARMGPSILLSTSCEAVAFSLGALVGMPAVRNFAIYAAGAVIINSLLQVTVFISLMSLDLQRTESNRVDCFPCLQMPLVASTHFLDGVNFIARFIRETYAPILLNSYVKKAVLAIFSLLFILSWISAREITLGLDQRLALPSDSYLVPYFNAVDNYLDVGPPVYFVAQNVDVEQRAGQQLLCSRFSTCNEKSLSNILEAERKRFPSSFLAEPPASWVDDFFQWLNPVLETCCRVSKRDPSVFCAPEDPDFRCQPCYAVEKEEWNITMEGLPTGAAFDRYLNQWIQAPTDENCPLGGQASYSSAIALQNDSVRASHFRTYHTPLKSQNDYIDAMAAAERIAADFSERTGTQVFPYSLFYVYFDQYATIVSTTRSVLSLACLAVFLVTSFFLGSLRTGAIVTFTVFLTTLNVMGIMGVWHISLNAISLVNLVISVGIAVEFCSHVARSFMGAKGGGLPFGHLSGPKERDERAWAALADVGSSVFTGITITKLIGVSVLAITRSKLLKTYYFRMWLVLIIAGALHGLVLLPVLLALQGGQGWSLESEDESWLRENIATSYEGRPFLAQDNDSDASEIEDPRQL